MNRPEVELDIAKRILRTPGGFLLKIAVLASSEWKCTRDIARKALGNLVKEGLISACTKGRLGTWVEQTTQPERSIQSGAPTHRTATRKTPINETKPPHFTDTTITGKIGVNSTVGDKKQPTLQPDSAPVPPIDLVLNNLKLTNYRQSGASAPNRPWTESGPKGHRQSQRIAAKIRNEIWEFLDEDHTASNVNWTLRLCWLFATTCSRRELITEKIEAVSRADYKSKMGLFRDVIKKMLKAIGISDDEFYRIKIDPEFLEQQRAIVESGQAASYAAADNHRIAQEEAQETHRRRKESAARNHAAFMERKAQAELEHEKREVELTAENKRRKKAREKRFADNRTTPEQQATRKQELLAFLEKADELEGQTA